jgi:hypothetical protein
MLMLGVVHRVLRMMFTAVYADEQSGQYKIGKTMTLVQHHSINHLPKNTPPFSIALAFLLAALTVS